MNGTSVLDSKPPFVTAWLAVHTSSTVAVVVCVTVIVLVILPRRVRSWSWYGSAIRGAWETHVSVLKAVTENTEVIVKTTGTKDVTVVPTTSVTVTATVGLAVVVIVVVVVLHI